MQMKMHLWEVCDNNVRLDESPSTFNEEGTPHDHFLDYRFADDQFRKAAWSKYDSEIIHFQLVKSDGYFGDKVPLPPWAISSQSDWTPYSETHPQMRDGKVNGDFELIFEWDENRLTGEEQPAYSPPPMSIITVLGAKKPYEAYLCSCNLPTNSTWICSTR